MVGIINVPWSVTWWGLLSHGESGFFTELILLWIHHFMVLLGDNENQKVDMVLWHDSVLCNLLCSSLFLFLFLYHLSVSLSHFLFLSWIVSFGVWFYLVFLIFSGFCCYYFFKKELKLGWVGRGTESERTWGRGNIFKFKSALIL